MANWMTGSEISARYIANEHKLLDYARRGNMPMLRGTDGVVRFDETHVATLFRPRNPALVVEAANGGPNMGVLGISHLGDGVRQDRTASTPPPREESEKDPISNRWSTRDAHRRAARFPRVPDLPALLTRKAG